MSDLNFNTLDELKRFVDEQEGSHDTDITCSSGIQKQFDAAASLENYNGVHGVVFLKRNSIDHSDGTTRASCEIRLTQFDANGDYVKYERTTDGNVVNQKWTFKDGSIKTNQFAVTE